MPLAKALADGFETATRYARMASISPGSANAPLPRCEHDHVDATAAPHSRVAFPSSPDLLGEDHVLLVSSVPRRGTNGNVGSKSAL